jgi:hypothetical protein
MTEIGWKMVKGGKEQARGGQLIILILKLSDLFCESEPSLRFKLCLRLSHSAGHRLLVLSPVGKIDMLLPW